MGYYVVSDFFSGGELFERVAQRTYFQTEQKVAKLVNVMLDTLMYIHERNITHRDLKPENFVFDDPSDDAKLVLIDFGFADKMDDFDKVGSIYGTPPYVSPE